ncbi:MAG TPA: hypothetical protein VNO31_39590 [Umezawaea sp.]|nr:hypothetical protein [Umezawaea sp.]
MGAHPRVQLYPPRREDLQSALGQPAPPGEQVGGVGAAGAGRAQARQPGGGRQPVPIIQHDQGGQLAQHVGDELVRHPDLRRGRRHSETRTGGGGRAGVSITPRR